MQLHTLVLDPLKPGHTRLMFVHDDRKGLIRDVTGAFPDVNVRQAHTMSPEQDGGVTVSVMDLDGHFTAELEKHLTNLGLVKGLLLIVEFK